MINTLLATLADKENATSSFRLPKASGSSIVQIGAISIDLPSLINAAKYVNPSLSLKRPWVNWLASRFDPGNVHGAVRQKPPFVVEAQMSGTSTYSPSIHSIVHNKGTHLVNPVLTIMFSMKKSTAWNFKILLPCAFACLGFYYYLWERSELRKCSHVGNHALTLHGDKHPPPIPVLGAVVSADPELFLTRFLHSIDFPVEDIIIVHGTHDRSLTKEIKLIRHTFANNLNLTIIEGDRWVGVSEGWNRILQSRPNASWYIIANNDVQFLPGALEAFARGFQTDVDVEFGFFTAQNIGNGSSGHTVFGLKSDVLDKVGYFDENIFPAYYEGKKYRRRYKVCNQINESKEEESLPIRISIHLTFHETKFIIQTFLQTTTMATDVHWQISPRRYITTHWCITAGLTLPSI